MSESILLPQAINTGIRVDWERVIIDIQRSTWLADKSQRKSLKAISHACGRGDTWAWSLKNIPGTQPTFHDGLMLLGLWQEKTGIDGNELPLLRDSKR